MEAVGIVSLSSAGEAARAAGQHVSMVLARYVGTHVLFLVSGGSALSVLSYISGDCIGENITLGTLDDRCTSDPELSNFRQLAKLPFYAFARERNVTLIPSFSEVGESVSTLADRMNAAYGKWIQENPEGFIIITQGIGPDGHTAGIMPYADEEDAFQRLFVDTDRFVVGYDAGMRTPLPKRVTASVPLLCRVSESILYACGEVKRTALKASLYGNGTLAEMPGRVIRQMRKVTLFTDIAL